MLSYGNGKPEVCVNNLVHISRGEVPYDRIRGVKLGQNIGRTIAERDEIADDTKWMVGTYEPRISVDRVEIFVTDAVNGQMGMTVHIIGGHSNE